ncbi:hypothetical protein BOTBODRAFT_52450 [Botryobasidium botryosum FD-172 SS1]|uniref:F-box domain-containing protein n=1 Tax=Botryobasidium botryosum (strain FD-172 SS1) TaxID=930990 RepID=A0A067N3S5_BOTB1|nr:hypothetical protein BOTBODRAFT_52450 [Botryobasidium botryosum FD-172 SS1]
MQNPFQQGAMITSTLAPNARFIHRLPPEIILEILKAHSLFVPSWRQPVLPMIRVAHVCRLWRAIIHRHPPFWATIHLDLYLCDRMELDQKARFWLARAGDELLDITINRSHTVEPNPFWSQPTGNCIAPLAGALCERVGRWRSFKICGTPRDVRLFFNSCVGLAAPNLGDITVVLQRDFNYGSLEVAGNPPLLIPFIQSSIIEPNVPLSISAICCIPEFPSFGADITQLHIEAKMFVCRGNNILDALKSCPNLEQFYLQGDLRPSAAQSQEFVTLPRLFSLEMDSLEARGPDGILPFLNAPLLRILSLHNIEWISETLWRYFRNCPLLSTISVRYETYTGYDGNPPELRSDTSLTLTAARQFEIHGNPIAYPLLQQLVIPAVEELTLRHVPCDIAHQLIASSTQLCALSLQKVAAITETLPPILLPALTSLKARDSLALLGSLRTSQLTSLTLAGEVNILRALLGAPLHELVERCAPSLIELELEDGVLDDDVLIACLTKLPRLEIFCLRRCTSSDAVLQALSNPSSDALGSGWLLPRLQKIYIESNIGITPAGIIELLASRNVISENHDATSYRTAPPRLAGRIQIHEEAHVTHDEFSKIESFGISMAFPASLYRRRPSGI